MIIKIKRSGANGEFFAQIISNNYKELWRLSETNKRKQTVQKAIDQLIRAIESGEFTIVDETK